MTLKDFRAGLSGWKFCARQKGGEKVGLTKRGRGSKVMLVVESQGIPLGVLVESITSGYLTRNWGWFPEWSTKKLKDDFYASPQLPRLTDSLTLRKTIADGVKKGSLGYAIRSVEGGHEEIHIDEPSFSEEEVEFSEQAVLLKREEALKIKEESKEVKEKEREGFREKKKGTDTGEVPIPTVSRFAGIKWEGEVPVRQLTEFSAKVLSRFASESELTLRIQFEAFPSSGISSEEIKEVKEALRGLSLDEERVEEIEEKGIRRSWDGEF